MKNKPPGIRTLPQKTFQRVKKGHIVPAVYQRNFAVRQQVAVHFTDGDQCEIRNVKTAGTRGAFYRRTRPDGTEIDDIEASLSALEDKVQPVFGGIISGEPLTLERKNVLAQFFGMQMVRGPAFFTERAGLMAEIATQLGASDIRPAALANAGGDVHVVRQKVLDIQLSSTTQFITMLTTGMKVASVLGSMRWHLLRFDGALLAYSDHPVVVWPHDVRLTEAFTTPKLGPLCAVEVRVPLAPELAILMTWADVPDTRTAVSAESRYAGELNAFVVAQADQQWMHRPGIEPTVMPGHFGPLSRSFEMGYSALTLEASRRRAFASEFLARVRDEKFLGEIEIAHMDWAE